MGLETAKARLKQQLLLEVGRFCRRDDRVWKKPIIETLRDLKEAKVEAVFFGGTLRSLLLSRLLDGKPGRPRDIDIVVSGASIETLRLLFGTAVSRETRFGGLHLRRREWDFDVWPLGQTWAFVRDAVTGPTFAALPSTTFFNLEAIAVDVWPPPGRARRLYSGDDQFFNGVLSRTLEVNREENPFPELCVVRALIMAADLNFRIGPKLAHYISRHGAHLTPLEIDELQQKHYGQRRADGGALVALIHMISASAPAETSAPITLPASQLRLWPDSDDAWHLRVHALSN
jgi:hypothetical protein